ncbi:MAG: MmgE/PrpD family protein [Chloroflexota bacterium]
MMTASSTPKETAIDRFATFVAEAKLSPDQQTIDMIRNAFIDTIGCILIGARQPVTQKTQATLSAWGNGVAPVLGTKLSLAPPWAAMANAVAGHALEFDDWETPGNTHPSIVIIPALLAAAAQRGVSGQAILEAYLVGFELIARLGEAINFEHYDAGWHSTGTLGAIGAAAAVARLNGLDHTQTAQALSIAVSQAVGYTRQFGSNAKPLQGGFAAKAGVVATALAENGLTGQSHILEGERGLVTLMGPSDETRLWAAIERLGKPLALTEYGLIVKPYLSCGYTHRVIDCALQIKQHADFNPTQIARIEASVPDFHAAILPFHQPQLREEALFSVPFCVALALLKRGVTLADLEAEAWTDPTIVNLISKTTFTIRRPKNPALNYDAEDPDWVTVEMQDGTHYRAAVEFPLGSPQNPMTAEQIIEKFLLNTAYATIDRADREAIITALTQWDKLPNINTVIQQLRIFS